MTGPDCVVMSKLINAYARTHLQQELSFHMRHHLCIQGVALMGILQLRSQGLVSVHVHRTKGVTGYEGRQGANEAGAEIGVGGGNGDGNGDVNLDEDGDGVGTRTGTALRVNEETQDWNGNGSGDGAGTGTGTGTGVETLGRTEDGNQDRSGDGNERSSGDRNGDEDGNGDGNEDGIGKGGREAKKRKKPHKRVVQLGDVGNEGGLGGKRNKRRQERVIPVAADPENLEKEARGEAQVTQSLSKNCTSRESVSPLSRLIRGFRNKYH